MIYFQLRKAIKYYFAKFLCILLAENLTLIRIFYFFKLTLIDLAFILIDRNSRLCFFFSAKTATSFKGEFH